LVDKLGECVEIRRAPNDPQPVKFTATSVPAPATAGLGARRHEVRLSQSPFS